MAVLETHSNFLQMDGTRVEGPVHMFMGRAAIQSGGIGEQEPYETQQGEMQSPTTTCRDKGLGADWLGRDQVSYEPAIRLSIKEGQWYPWLYEQEHGQEI